MSLANTILMIRPAAFGFNNETAVNNFFQSRPAASKEKIQRKALEEFDNMVSALRANDIDVFVVDDTAEPQKPDAVFPNNWISTLPGGIIVIYPMYAPSRRLEKRDDILQKLSADFVVNDVQDWSEFEAEERYLEGTGSMVMDHENKLIYASVSERTSPYVLERFAGRNGYQAIVFLASDKSGRPVYHTNVVMSLGKGFAVLCDEAIGEEWELIAVRQLLESTGHEIISITKDQMHAFAGNMLEVKNKAGKSFLILSQVAYESLDNNQRGCLERFTTLLPIAVPTIEEVEGGSVRCMIAEIFLDRKN